MRSQDQAGEVYQYGDQKQMSADSKMVEQIMGFGPREISAVIDYASRLRPPDDKLAQLGWRNPDFSVESGVPGGTD